MKVKLVNTRTGDLITREKAHAERMMTGNPEWVISEDGANRSKKGDRKPGKPGKNMEGESTSGEG